MAVSATAQQAQKILDDKTLAEEELLDEFDDDEIPAHIREKRMEEFRKQASELQNFREKQHGQYSVIMEEKDFLDMTTTEERCVVHFFHEDFRRCAIMDTHLENLSKKYFETKFAKLNVDKAKFFVNKLNIRVLPAVICFKNGMVVDRVVGFDDMGNTDSFPTELLERRLGNSGVITLKDLESNVSKSIFGHQRTKKDEDSDDDNDW